MVFILKFCQFHMSANHGRKEEDNMVQIWSLPWGDVDSAWFDPCWFWVNLKGHLAVYIVCSMSLQAPLELLNILLTLTVY